MKKISDRILKKSGKVLLLGNEAIVRGALESGVGFASTYPGTPASEIGDTFAEISKDVGIYFEYSVNEKVALEAAAGAALSGIRSLVSFKHFGMNVASDSMIPLAYIETSGLVIVVADDPNCWSSAQSEQDSRVYGYLAHIPVLEPCDPQECLDFTKIAFDLSKKFKIPVIIRLTTRVAHARADVQVGKIPKLEKRGKFVKNISRFNNMPPHTMAMHEKLLKKIEKIKNLKLEKVNYVLSGSGDFGIIASGVSFNYVIEALADLKLKIPVLKIGMTYPLPEKIIKNFVKNLKCVLVVEELEKIVEEKVAQLAKDVNPGLKIYGKNVLPKSGEYTEEIVISAICAITGQKPPIKIESYLKKYSKMTIAQRFALMCPGCPHRATFYAAKLATKEIGQDVIYGGDIGCYILGIYPPLEMQDFIISMGASEGLVHGIKKTSDQKAIAFIGDSTFFHAGIPGLINMVYNKSNPLVIVLDNRITAMTGHQPHPGTGLTGMGETTKAVKIEDVARACGVENVKVIDPFNIKEMSAAIKEFLTKDKVSVIVAKRLCQLLAVRQMKKSGVAIPKYQIEQSKCTKCGICLKNFACPAFYTEKGKYYINTDICTGCGVCVDVCPAKAVKRVER